MLTEGVLDGSEACCGFNVCVKTVNVYCKKVGVVGNCHGPDSTEEVVGILDVAGVPGGERVKKMVKVDGDIVGGGVAV